MRAPIKRWVFGAAFTAVVAYAFITLNGPHGLRALSEKQDAIRQMQTRNTIEAQQIERIREHIKRLDDNPSEQEREIRDRLKLVRPDEKVFITGPAAKK